MHGIKIRKPGLLTTVQDLGRYGFQRDGMVVAGAMDAYSMQLGNILVGNSRNTASLEITMLGPEVTFVGDHLISICGGVGTPLLNDKPIPLWTALAVRDGDRLNVGRVKLGCRIYLAIAGGFTIPKVLRSYSTYLAGELGGWQGRALQENDFLPTNLVHQDELKKRIYHYKKRERSIHRSGAIARRKITTTLIPRLPKQCMIRVTLGPQAAAFSEMELEKFFNSTYEITPASNRMGYRLKGDPLTHKEKADILSDATPLGSVQIPADGQPIILMADRQPTGGYTKIAIIVQVDIAKVAQLAPGDQISFQKISMEEAQRLMVQEEKLLRALEIVFSQ